MKSLSKALTLLFTWVFAVLSVAPPAAADTARVQNRYNFRGGTVNARDYANWKFQLGAAVAATSASAAAVPYGTLNSQRGGSQSCFTSMGNGRNIQVMQPGNRVLVIDGTLTETVTLTAVSMSAAPNNECTITATFANAHSAGVILQSGAYGLDEATYDLAVNGGGGVVAVDPDWQGTAAQIQATTPYGTVSIYSTQFGGPQFWNIQQATATFLAAPATLTAVTALFSTTPAGSYTTAAAYFMCVSYVDVGGQEGPCSATFSQTPGTTLSSLTVTPPAASTGAVGYTIYISLTNGTYSLAYQVPITSSICTMTVIETVTPACAVANTTYGQAGATATVTALTVSTSLVDPQLAGVSGTLLTPAANGRTIYQYVPSTHPTNGFPTTMLAYTVGGIGSATPISIGSINLPAGIMNLVGKSIRICGRFTNTDVNSSIQNINIYWDAAGSNTAGSPVQIGALASTQTGTAAAYNGTFCETFVTTVAGAGATAGSIRPGPGWLTYMLTSANSVFGIGGDTGTAAVASLNLAGATVGNGTRINIVHTNTTGNATPQLVSLTFEVL